MARRRRVKPERGWATMSGRVDNVCTTVDNIRTVAGSDGLIIDFEDLVSQDDEVGLADQDKTSEYYIEALKMTYQCNAVLGVGNALGLLPVWVGLMIAETGQHIDPMNLGLENLYSFTNFYDQDFRGVDSVRQVLRVNLHLAAERYGVEASDNLTSQNVLGGDTWYHHMETGPIHLRRGEGLFLITSQSGGTVYEFQTWVDGDEAQVGWEASLLIRKKRGR